MEIFQFMFMVKTYKQNLGRSQLINHCIPGCRKSFAELYQGKDLCPLPVRSFQPTFPWESLGFNAAWYGIAFFWQEQKQPSKMC